MKGESILQMDKPRPSRGQRTQCLPHAAESAVTDKMAISLPCFKALCGCPLLAAPNPSTVSWAVWTYMDQSPTPTPAGPPFFLEGPGSSHFHPFAHAVLSTQVTLPPPAHLDYTSSTFNT